MVGPSQPGGVSRSAKPEERCYGRSNKSMSWPSALVAGLGSQIRAVAPIWYSARVSTNLPVLRMKPRKPYEPPYETPVRDPIPSARLRMTNLAGLLTGACALIWTPQGHVRRTGLYPARNPISSCVRAPHVLRTRRTEHPLCASTGC